MTDLAELIAKNNPSDPLGANDAVQDDCRGDHNTSPIVMNTCHAQDPITFGDIATKIGDNAMIHSPVRMVELGEHNIICVRNSFTWRIIVGTWKTAVPTWHNNGEILSSTCKCSN